MCMHHAHRPISDANSADENQQDPQPKAFQNYLQKHYLFLLYPFSSRYSGCSFKYGSLSPQMA